MDLKNLSIDYRGAEGTLGNKHHKMTFALDNFEQLLFYAMRLKSEVEDLNKELNKKKSYNNSHTKLDVEDLILSGQYDKEPDEAESTINFEKYR